MSDQAESIRTNGKGAGAPIGNSNAVTHGARRFMETGQLPPDLTGLDTEIQAEVLRQVGGNEKFNLISRVVARAFVINELVYQHAVRQHKEHPEELPAALKIFGSYQESLRRCLNELGLTPASAGKVPEQEPVNAKDVLDAVKGKTNEPND